MSQLDVPSPFSSRNLIPDILFCKEMNDLATTRLSAITLEAIAEDNSDHGQHGINQAQGECW